MKKTKSKKSDSANEIARFKKYFGEIEKRFSNCFGAPLLLSPRDVAKAKEWLSAGIPSRVVRQGIDRYFERLAPRKRRRALSIRYCENDILDIWERRRAQGADSTKETKRKTEEEFKKILKRIKIAEKKTSKNADLAWLAPLWKIFASEIEKADKKKVSLKKLSARLTKRAEKFLKKRAPKELLNGYVKNIARELSSYRARMSDEVFKKTVEYYALEKLKRECKIPKF